MNGLSAAALARMYGLAAETVRRILRGETWAWVTNAPAKSVQELDEEAARSQEKFQAMLAAAKAPRALQAEVLEGLGDVPEAVRRKAAEFLGRPPKNPMDELED